jgi:selenocysteine lyase/cysteine desulfurase
MTLAPWLPRCGYLNTASFGIPPPAAVKAVETVTSDWANGRLTFGGWFTETQLTRTSIAALLAVPQEWVSLGGSSAPLLGSVAAGLPDGARVLAPENEHNSNLIPYLNQAHRGVSLDLVPLSELAARVGPGTTLVSCSAVQSLTGEVADISAIRAATAASGSLFCLDGSQACGWLPLSGASADVIVCSMYKWLCTPIGGAFMVMRPEVAEQFRPVTPGWVAATDPMAAPYGPELQLPPSGRKFDTVPNLISMIAARQSIDAIVGLGVDAINRHDVTLANRLRTGLQTEPSNSAIVSLPWEGAAKRLATAAIVATEWRGNLRLSFHVHNDESDVDAALDVLTSIPRPS